MFACDCWADRNVCPTTSKNVCPTANKNVCPTSRNRSPTSSKVNSSVIRTANRQRLTLGASINRGGGLSSSTNGSSGPPANM